jgi:hypothetical protein
MIFYIVSPACGYLLKAGWFRRDNNAPRAFLSHLTVVALLALDSEEFYGHCDQSDLTHSGYTDGWNNDLGFVLFLTYPNFQRM